jgi:hypothetical protein
MSPQKLDIATNISETLETFDNDVNDLCGLIGLLKPAICCVVMSGFSGNTKASNIHVYHCTSLPRADRSGTLSILWPALLHCRDNMPCRNPVDSCILA